jgi:hypothetical protein
VSRFYAELPLLTRFSEVTEPERFAPLPPDWHVAACDVRNSTAAVRAGDYKQVNTVAAAAVTAVLNAAGATEIPFIFEGDGSAFCVPPELVDDTRAALAKTREMARASFGLDLRVATVPAARVREAGFDILVARYRVSENYVQAVFAGGGMAWAERYMKDPATAELCAVGAGVAPRGSHEGLECRWRDIPSPYGETVSLIVRAGADHPHVYRELIAQVAEIYGSDECCHPVTLPALAMTLEGERLDNEVGVRVPERGAWGRWRRRMWIRLVVLLGWFLMRFRIRTQETDWSRYKPTLVRNSDVRKFNDVYRQVLAGTAAQRAALTAWLEERHARRELAYGLHVADRAHMTCLVFDYAGRHLHFIDGADGGFFAAAVGFKERAATLNRVMLGAKEES